MGSGVIGLEGASLADALEQDVKDRGMATLTVEELPAHPRPTRPDGTPAPAQDQARQIMETIRSGERRLALERERWEAKREEERQADIARKATDRTANHRLGIAASILGDLLQDCPTDAQAVQRALRLADALLLEAAAKPIQPTPKGGK